MQFLSTFIPMAVASIVASAAFVPEPTVRVLRHAESVAETLVSTDTEVEMATVTVDCTSKGSPNVYTPSVIHDYSTVRAPPTTASSTSSNGALQNNPSLSSASTKTLSQTSTDTIFVSRSPTYTSSSSTSSVTVPAISSTQSNDAVLNSVSPFLDSIIVAPMTSIGISAPSSTNTTTINTTITVTPIPNISTTTLRPSAPVSTAGAVQHSSHAALLGGVMAFAMLAI